MTRPLLSARQVRDLRGPRTPLDPRRSYGVFVDSEPGPHGAPLSTGVVLLTNRECPFRCVFCDLWRNTLEHTSQPDELIDQVRHALAQIPAGTRQIKLYNAGSFFDPRAIPPDTLPRLVPLLARFERVIVECHPAFVRGPLFDFAAALDGQLEVAMGLEVADDHLLAALAKGMTLASFRDAAERLAAASVALRCFIMVQPPGVPADDAVQRARESVDFAVSVGSATETLIPARGGNGAMEELARQGLWTPPSLATFTEAVTACVADHAGPGHRVLADLWDIERLACPDDAREALLGRLRPHAG